MKTRAAVNGTLLAVLVTVMWWATYTPSAAAPPDKSTDTTAGLSRCSSQIRVGHCFRENAKGVRIHVVRTEAKAIRPRAVAAAADPLTCTGYPEERVFWEVQSWWTEPGIAEPMHLHAATCFPLGKNMSGTSTFDVRVMLHRNPGTLFALSFDFYSGYEQYINVADVTCGIANDCIYWYQVTVNWSNVPAGWRELRLKPRVKFPPSFDTTSGATQITSSGAPVQVRGGTSGTRSSCQSNKTTCYTESRGWYKLRGYQNVQINNLNLLIGPGNTWSGTKLIPVKLNCGCGGEDTPTTHWAAYVDPDFHNGSIGTLVASGTGSFNGNITLNTTQFSNGPHRLVLRAGSNQPSNAVPGSLDGLGVYPFVASN